MAKKALNERGYRSGSHAGATTFKFKQGLREERLVLANPHIIA